MIITNIQTQKQKNRFNLFVDQKFVMGISEDTLIAHQLYKGKNITDKELTQLVVSEELAQAKDSALNYLSFQMRSCFEIKQYLQKKGFSEQVATEAVQKLQAINLLNDLQLANNYLKTMQQTSDKGPLVIKKKLQQRKISPELIAQAFATYDFQLDKQRLSKLVMKYFQHYHRDSFKQRLNKVKQRLLTKGFSGNAIDEILNTIPATDEQTEQAILTQQLDKLSKRYSQLPLSKRRQKCLQAMIRKGFAFADVQQALNELKE